MNVWCIAHSPDNSFMGFVVERHTPVNGSSVEPPLKKNWAVVYGKAEYMWSVSTSDLLLSIYPLTFTVAIWVQLYSIL